MKTLPFPCDHYENDGHLTVACVNYKNYLGRGDEYVSRLWEACHQHLCVPHNFVCLRSEYTNNPFIGELPLPPIDIGNNPGYWMKVALFRPGALTGRVLYLDLDVEITGDITGLAKLLDKSIGPWALDDFEYPIAKPKANLTLAQKYKLGGMPGTCNSSVMLWDADAAAIVWNTFAQGDDSQLAGLGGDQNFITKVLLPKGRLHLIPPGWARSYRLGGEGPITVFHGNPKPHEVAW